MVARILVAENEVNMKKFLVAEGTCTPEVQVWRLEVSDKGVKIAELRAWLRASYLNVKGGEMMVFWIDGADNLSEQCQSLLLKPLEESRDEVLFVLTAKNESRLLPTILSRCQVSKLVTGTDPVNGENYWKELIQAWKAGPGASIALLDRWEKDEELKILSFLTERLAKGLRVLPSVKRVKILGLALELKKDAGLMVNRKLLLGRFLLEGGWISGLDSNL